jgi:flagellar biosynthesis chaperone FliJ
VALDLESLRAERDRAKEQLRELETESRRLEAELKGLRLREVQAKREIEAYNALIEVGESRVQAASPEASK